MGSLPEGECLSSLHHSQIIKEVVHPSFASHALIRSYKRSFNGFAAYLTQEEKHKLTRIAGVISVFPCQKLILQTTRSWDFMGLSQRIERRHEVESDIIIGVINTGIWPESESFSDEGIGPVPSKWKGECDGGKDFVCNRKIIGARSFGFESGELSARDKDGHGTHVASILAGNQVRDVSYYGLAHGIARGGVPSARLAVYKVCEQGCYDIDVLSAFDHAIADGVDIISLSMAYPNGPLKLTSDPFVIGSFHAIEKGILTVNGAGNDGPGFSSILNYAPWTLTVAASDIDRKVVDKLLLKNDAILVGYGINAFPSSDEAVPLVYGKEVTNNCSEIEARNCYPTCLERSLVNHKVILCDDKPDWKKVNISGAVGVIYPFNTPESATTSLVMPYPMVTLSGNDLNLVKTFKKSTIDPRVQIFKSETVDNPDAPLVASFSSRGPSIFMYDIIKVSFLLSNYIST
ncbi:putative cucumisin [Helianthus annuus]|nr:putative cucumisin [Helianthus annuus]KAJ0727150.1 putative cucumisin [Helianthus annuus]